MKKKHLLHLLCIILALVPVICIAVIPFRDISAAVISLDCDLNGDGRINSKDVIRLLKHVKDPEKYPFDKNADINSDGVISSDDITALLPFFDHTTEIIKNGKAQYDVLCSSNASDTVIQAAEMIIDAVYERTGVLLELTYDSVADPNGKYLIVGESTFGDCQEIKAAFNNASDTYAIGQTQRGNIAVISNYESYITQASSCYINDILPSCYDKKSQTLTFKSYYHKGTDILPNGFCISDLSKTKIVYATDLDGYRTVADTLRNTVKSVYNIEMQICADTETPVSAREILIGRTNRDLSVSHYANGGYIMEYDVVADSGALQILCGGSFSARKAAEELASSLFKSSNANKTLPKGSYTSKNMLAPVLSRPSATSARIMTFNVMPYTLGEATYANALPVRERVELFAGLLISSSPDVLGLQEAGFKWQEQIPHYIGVLNEKYGLGYDFVLCSYNGKNNYTPMIYRADKYTALECKYQHYDYHTSSASKNGVYLRGASQLVLQSKTAPDQRFIVINSHWDHGSQLANLHPQYMNECASSEAAIVNSYKEKYPQTRIFCVGDFNSHRFNGVFFKQFCSEINGLVASDVARTNGTLKVAGGFHGSGSNLSEYKTRYDFTPVTDSFIDHVVFTSSSSSVKTSVLNHNTVYGTEGFCHIISDHCPVYADFGFTAG